MIKNYTVDPKVVASIKDKLSSDKVLDKMRGFVYINLVWKAAGSLKMINVYMNQALREALGYTRREIEQIDDDFFEKIIHKEVHELERESFNFLINQKGQHKEFESAYHFICKNGNSIRAVGNSSLMEPNNGSPYSQFINCTTPVSYDSIANCRILQVFIETNDRINKENLGKITKTEMKIIREIIKGSTTNEVAEKFNTSPNTVETHRRNINSKLGVRNIVELMNFAQHNNIS